jgi:hypothetical protein
MASKIQDFSELWLAMSFGIVALQGADEAEAIVRMPPTRNDNAS